MNCFCIDIDATKTAKLLGLNRETVNRYFMLFRESIYWHQMNLKNQFFGEIKSLSSILTFPDKTEPVTIKPMPFKKNFLSTARRNPPEISFLF